MRNDRTTVLQQYLDRVKAGDAAARQELLERAAERLRRLTRVMLHASFERLYRWEQTDDVFGAALFRLHRRLETYTPATLAQFFAIAAQEIRRQLLDLVRHYFGPNGPATHQAAHLHVEDAEGGPAVEAPPASWDPAELAAWGDFHRLVEALPVEERLPFDLIWYHGMTQAEAAEILGICSKTVRARYREACLRLGRALGWDVPGR